MGYYRRSFEFGEKIENRLKKEIKEEYKTDILKIEFLGYDDVHRSHKGEKTHWVSFLYKVLIDPKKKLELASHTNF